MLPRAAPEDTLYKERRPTIPLGAFDLFEQVGKGGMGVVWLGQHREQKVPVAVKVVSPRQGGRVLNVSAFENEVRTAAGLDHPNIVQLFDYGRISRVAERRSHGELLAGSPYLVMEWASEGTLASRRGFVRNWEELRDVLRALLGALAHAHASGVVHRDLKPGNVLICADDALRPGLKLADFGLAQAEDQVKKDGTRPAGTPLYMPPEQGAVRSRDQGPWTDLYSLGCVAYKLATGAAPFRGETAEQVAAAHLHDPVPPLLPMFQLPERFEAWLHILLAKDPRDRFQLAADAAFALTEIDRPPSVVFHGHSPNLRVPPMPHTWRSAVSAKQQQRLRDVGLGLFGLRHIPLAGRYAERDAMWAALAGVRRSGRATMVILEGPTGVGTSRLAQWLCGRANEVGAAQYLKATHSSEQGEQDGLGPMLAAWTGCAGLTYPAALDRLEKLLRVQGVTEPYEWEALAELVIPNRTDQGRVRFSGLGQSHTLIRRTIERIGRDRPVIVWIDDAQWGLPALEFALSVLEAQEAEPAPILLVLCVQQDALRDQPSANAFIRILSRQPEALHLQIDPLDSEASRALITSMLGLDKSLVTQLEARVAGNPLLAVQIVSDWIQRGVLAAGERGFTLREGTPSDMPHDVHDAWRQRIERILSGRPVEQVQALEIAALLGLDVPHEEWANACAAVSLSLPYELVEALVRRGLLTWHESRRAEGWSFAHGALREVIEAGAVEAGRDKLNHMACARMLARQGGPRSPERRGRHLLKAGEPLSALGPLGEGVANRLAVGSLRAAAVLLREREEAMEALQLPINDTRWGDGAILAAQVLWAQGNADAALNRLVAGEAQAMRYGWMDLLPRMHLEMARIVDARGDAREAWRLLSAAENEAKAGTDAALLAECRLLLGWMLQSRGEARKARAYFARAIAEFDELKDDLRAASAHLGLAESERQSGRLAEARRIVRRAQQLYRVCGARWGVASCKAALGDIARAEEDWDEAERQYREARAQFVALGHAGATPVELALGLTLLGRRDWDGANQRLAEALGTMEQQGQVMRSAAAHGGLLACAAALHDWVAWERHGPQVARLLRDTRLRDMDVAWTLQTAGEQAAAAGDLERARMVWRLSAHQWRAVQRDAEAGAVEALIQASEISQPSQSGEPGRGDLADG